MQGGAWGQNIGGAVKKRRIAITIEVDEVLVITPHSGINRVWCASCGKQVNATSLKDVYRYGLTGEAAQRQAETGRLHLIKRVGDLSFVCLDSLVQRGSLEEATDPLAKGIHKIPNQSEKEKDS
jgi:hypothetical protein